MELREGVVVGGRFRLERELGKGAMGVVWRARHMGLDIPCAVKVIRAQAATSAEHVSRFEREAKAAAQIRSPHVVQLLDHGVWEGLPYMAMELLEGEDLEARLERVGKLRPEEVVALFRPLARALKKAHDMGLVHRDLKPANIFLAKDGDEEVPKILDFGIVKDRSQETQTRAGAILGTPYYLSPEQARSSRDIDHRSDLWSLAVVVYRCVVGRLPFNADSLGDLIIQILSSPVPVPSHYADVPPGFDAWWARATAKNPAERYQSAQELVDTLATVLAPAQAAPRDSALPAAPQAAQAAAHAAAQPGQDHHHHPHAHPQAQGTPGAYGQNAGPGPGPGYGPPQATPAGYGPAPAGYGPAPAAGYGPPPPVPAAGHGPPPAGPAAAAPARKASPWLAIGIGCGGLVVLSLGFVTCLGVIGASGGGVGLTACGQNMLCTPTKVPDPAHVDALEILSWVRQVARSADSRAELVMITTPEVEGGTVDVTQGQSINYQFNAPGTVLAIAVGKTQTVVTKGAAARTDEPIANPGCTLRGAWRSAVVAGMAEDASPRFVYSGDPSAKGGRLAFNYRGGHVYLHPGTCAVMSGK
jgi:hypothetical protein